jgi:hypothetical protein
MQRVAARLDFFLTERSSSMQHLVLAGDSVFDNAAYVGNGPDVIHQLRAVLPDGWRATLLAVDGASIVDMQTQLARLPTDASHVVVSVGGNDALAEAGLLEQEARSVAEVLDKLATVRERFGAAYGKMLDRLPNRAPIAVSTIYEPRFPDPTFRRLAATALTVLNDCITSEAFRRDLTLLDLRLICNDDSDFANPIEPSVHGGAKIVQALARFAIPNGGPRSGVIAR